jgi:hypothetical protein
MSDRASAQGVARGVRSGVSTSTCGGRTTFPDVVTILDPDGVFVWATTAVTRSKRGSTKGEDAGVISLRGR